MAYIIVTDFLDKNKGKWYSAKQLRKLIPEINRQNLYSSLKKIARIQGYEFRFVYPPKKTNRHAMIAEYRSVKEKMNE